MFDFPLSASANNLLYIFPSAAQSEGKKAVKKFVLVTYFVDKLVLLIMINYVKQKFKWDI